MFAEYFYSCENFLSGLIVIFLLLPLFVWVITNHQILHEERILEEKFERHYLAYKERVRRWL